MMGEGKEKVESDGWKDEGGEGWRMMGEERGGEGKECSSGGDRVIYGLSINLRT